MAAVRKEFDLEFSLHLRDHEFFVKPVSAREHEEFIDWARQEVLGKVFIPTSPVSFCLLKFRAPCKYFFAILNAKRSTLLAIITDHLCEMIRNRDFGSNGVACACSAR
jgi:hypothetical protein